MNIIKKKKLDNEVDNFIKHNINSVSSKMKNNINNDKINITDVSYHIIKIHKDGGEYDEKKDKEYLKDDIKNSFSTIKDFKETVKNLYHKKEQLKDRSHILFVHYNSKYEDKLLYHYECSINEEGIKTTDFGIKGLKCKIKYFNDEEPGKLYEGEMKNERIEGNGKMCYKNGATYEGTFKDGYQEKGKITCSDGIVIDVETITDEKTSKEKRKRTLNGADVTKICEVDGNFTGYGDIIWDNGNSITKYTTKWNNNEVELNKNAKPLIIPILTIKEKNKVAHPPEDTNHNNIIANNKKVLKHEYMNNDLILTKADIGHNPPKRLCNIPFINRDLLWPTCCSLICSKDLDNDINIQSHSL